MPSPLFFSNSLLSLQMASLSLLILALLPIIATARPCKTLFISYTISSSSSASDPTLEYSQISTSADHNPSRFFAVYRIITPFRPMPLSDLRRPVRFDRPDLRRDSVGPARPAAFGISSLQDRAKDILVVVAGLLFGVGCGAITAATMYLAWSLVTNQYEICGSDDVEEEEDESPKKMGYVKIADPVVTSAKEGYEGN